MNKRSSGPWYTEPWPWILMAGPAAVVVAGSITTWLALSTADGLVEDDYYKQGLAVNQQKQRDELAAVRGLSAELAFGDDQRKLRLLLRAEAAMSQPAELVLHFSHPTRSGFDRLVRLRQGPDGFYSGELADPISGRWHVKVDDPSGNWRLTGIWDIEKDLSLRLAPGGR